MELIISRNLEREKREDISTFRLLMFRRLRKSEKVFAKKKKIHRYYLPSLELKEKVEFFSLFDKWWNNLCKEFPQQHVFWRNVVSSKMQEWETSLSYLALTLFTLSKSQRVYPRLIVICQSIEEEAVWIQWAAIYGWTVVSQPTKDFLSGRRIIQNLRNFAFFIKLVIVNIQKKMFSPRKRIFATNSHAGETVLVASLFYPSSFENGRFVDPFLGRFHEFLTGNDKRCMYLSDILSKPTISTAKVIQSCHDAIVNTPHSVLSWIELFGALGRVLFRRIRVTSLPFMGCDFSRVFGSKAGDFSRTFNIDAEIFYVALKKLCHACRFDQLILIYEGNVFERACIQAFREVSGGQICGYSHGVVFQSNLKLRLVEQEKNLRPEPDFIVCTGPYTKKLLANIGGARDVILKEGCSLRFIPYHIRRKSSSMGKKRILVALDGVRSTAGVLDWLVEHKTLFADYEVYVRAHPNVLIPEISKYMLEDILETFKISNNHLEEGLGRSSCVIYRHTSVGIQALLNNISSIHLDIDSPLSGDPIEDFSADKWSARNAAELEGILNKIEQIQSGGSPCPDGQKRENIHEYFVPPTEERMCDFLNLNDMSQKVEVGVERKRSHVDV